MGQSGGGVCALGWETTADPPPPSHTSWDSSARAWMHVQRWSPENVGMHCASPCPPPSVASFLLPPSFLPLPPADVPWGGGLGAGSTQKLEGALVPWEDWVSRPIWRHRRAQRLCRLEREGDTAWRSLTPHPGQDQQVIGSELGEEAGTGGRGGRGPRDCRGTVLPTGAPHHLSAYFPPNTYSSYHTVPPNTLSPSHSVPVTLTIPTAYYSNHTLSSSHTQSPQDTLSPQLAVQTTHCPCHTTLSPSLTIFH